MDGPTPKRARLDSTSSTSSVYLEDPPPLPEPAFKHFKILYDQSWDYPQICKDFFLPEHPYLCVIEHLNKPNTHVHFQGMSLAADSTLKNQLTRLVSHHHLRKFNPKCRPSSMSCRPPNVTGFQYMCKEVKPEHVLASNQFTLEQLMELKAKSELHCKDLKTSVKDLCENFTQHEIEKECQIRKSSSANDAIRHTGRYLVYGEDTGKWTLPPYNRHYTRQSVIEGLRRNQYVPREVRGELYVL